MVFDDSSVTLSPADTESVHLDLTPALLAARNHIAMKICPNLVAVRWERNGSAAIPEPQGQSMGRLEAALLHNALFQTGTQHLQPSQLRQFLRGPEQALTKEHRLTLRQLAS